MAKTQTAPHETIAVQVEDEDTLAAASDAVQRYRDLAAQRPDVYRAGLADALLLFADCLEECGYMRDALAATVEALQVGATLFQSRPPEYAAKLARTARDYIARATRAGQEPDMDLLASVTVAFQIFQDARKDVLP